MFGAIVTTSQKLFSVHRFTEFVNYKFTANIQTNSDEMHLFQEDVMTTRDVGGASRKARLKPERKGYAGGRSLDGKRNEARTRPAHK